MLNKIFEGFYLSKHPDGKAPLSVIKGVLLLYLAVVLQLISNVLDGFNLSAFIFVFFALVFLVFSVGEGRKWARLVLLILIIFNLLMLVFNLTYTSTKHPQPMIATTPLLYIFLYCAEVIIEVYAMILLFSKEARGWFNRKQ
jgi:drug/metabolite transporter (DMT)-like permease